MSQKSCFLIGHREVSEKIYPALYAAIEEHTTRYGVTEFMVGRYGSFDSLAAKVVKTTKQSHPEVELTLLLPYHPAERPIPVPDGFDSTYYPPGMERYPQGCYCPGKSVYSRSYRFSHCLCVAPCQQRKRSSGICKEEEGKGFIRVTALPHNDF